MLTPTTLAGVRGTKFEVNVGKDGSTAVNVYEGRVAARPRLAELEELPDAIVQKTESLNNVVASLESSEQIVESGQTLSVKKSETDKILKDSGIAEVIAKVRPDVRLGMSDDEIQKAIAIIEKSVEESEKKEQLKKKSEIKMQEKVQKIKEKEFEKKLKEYEELIAVEKQKLEDSKKVNDVIKERNAKEKAVLMKRIEQVVGKSSETLLLKDGTKVEGVIFQDGGNYIVLTPHGKEVYPESQVDGIEL